MSRPVYKWMVVYSSGLTEIHFGETPSYILYDMDDMEYNIVAIIRLND